MFDPDMGHWVYNYDANGNLTYQKDARNQEIWFDYDELNRVILKDYPDGIDITYVYDEVTSTNAKGRMTMVTDSTGTTVFNYDALGHITRSDKTLSLDSSTYTTQTQYDPLGRVKKIIYPDTTEVDYTYDGNGNIFQVKSGAVPYVTYNNYTALGKPLLVTFNNGVTTQYQYYPENNRLKKIYTTNGTGLMDLEYFYDNIGNITLLTDHLDSNKTRSYKYDDLDRLIESDSPSYGGKLLYQYDTIGNMTYNCKFGHYYYEDANHVHAVTSVRKSDGTLAADYQYDENGNMEHSHDYGNNVSRDFTYDFDNRPESITYNGNEVVNVYDVNGNRVHKMLSSPSDNITYIGQLYECSSGTGECTKYIFAGEQRIAQVKTLGADIDTYYYHTDHLSSSTVITAGDDVEENPVGDQLEEIHYYPFGEIHTNSGSVNVRHKFAGHEFDSETGLIYMGARYYDPKLARFITADPVVPARVDQHNFLSFKVREDLTNPQKLNRYSYCGNNPVVLRDPFGLDWTFVDTVSTGLGIASAVAGTVALANPPAKPVAAGITGLSAGFSFVANKAGYMSDSEANRNYALAAADLAGAGLGARGLINTGNLFSIIARALGIANTGYDAAKAAGNDSSASTLQSLEQAQQQQLQQSQNQIQLNTQSQLPQPATSHPQPMTQITSPSVLNSGQSHKAGDTATSAEKPNSPPQAPGHACPVSQPATSGNGSTGYGGSGGTTGVTSPQSTPTCPGPGF